MCHTSDICVLCMVTSVTWSWPWTELNIKHLLNQCLALYFRSTRGKFWPKTDNFEVSTARNLKAPILTFDLTLTWHVPSFGKFRGCFRIVSSRAFKRRIVRLSAAIRSRVMTWGRLTPPPPPSKSRVAKYPSKCRGNEKVIIYLSHLFCFFLTRHRLGGGVGSDPPPPRFFFRNNFFIYYCIVMKLGTSLRASIWRRLVQRKSKSAGHFLLYVEFCDVTSRDFGPIKGKCLKIHQK